MKLSLLLLVFCLQSVLGEYLITTPQKWAAGYEAQICVTIPEGYGSVDESLRLTIYSLDSRPRRPSIWWRGPASPEPPIQKTILSQDIDLQTPEYGKVCTSIPVPDVPTEYGEIRFTGKLGGKEVNETRYITFATKMFETFVSTDKYLYKAGQIVKFRILTIEGPFFKVSTEPYSSIYVETPSGARIAQWLNVSNTNGLIHKELQLIDEPEEGTYLISVTAAPGTKRVVKAFRIQDFVLPRFEMLITKPKYLLATDKSASFKVCTTYTFGQPVRGKLTGTIDNGGWRRSKVKLAIKEDVFGCADINVPLDDLKVNDRDFYVYRINLNVKFEEDGTGNVEEKSDSITVTRTVLTLMPTDYAPYKKAELPWTNVVKASFPDGSPAAKEEFSACAGESCFTVQSDDQGLVRFSIPPHLHDERKVELSAVNYPEVFRPEEDETSSTFAPLFLPLEPVPLFRKRRSQFRRHRRPYMYASKINLYASDYYSPTNSSLLLMPPNSRKIQCSPGSPITLEIPILFSANDTMESTLNVEVVSRGQIQHFDSYPVAFSPTDLNEFGLNLVAPMKRDWSMEKMVVGATNLTLTIPPTMSPQLEILVWYVRYDGEVVPDSRQIEVSKCLPHQVGVQWPVSQAEQGTTQKLTLSAEPNSLCSLGIVDKSVELLSSGQERLTLENIFHIADRVRPSSWEANQIDNTEYCKQFFPEDKEEPVEPLEPVNTDLPIPAIDEDGPMDIPIAELPIGSSPASDPLVPSTPSSSDVPSPPEGTDTSEPVAEFRKKRSFRPFPGVGYRTNAVDAIKMFDDAGLFVITDMAVETRVCTKFDDYHDHRITSSFGNFAPPALETSDAAPALDDASLFNRVAEREDDGPIVETKAEEPRSYFPETWLWHIIDVPENGLYEEDLKLPDTITQWVGRAVCVHPTKGVGLSAPSSITTFTPFFVDLTLLPSIRQGEIMPIVISVFNYLNRTLPVNVVLGPSPQYDILEGNSTTAAEDQTSAGKATLCIVPGDKSTATIRIRPQVAGDVELIITASVDMANAECNPDTTSLPNKSDTIKKTLKVEYEGFPRDEAFTEYICAEDLPQGENAASWTLEAPSKDIVPGSTRAWVTVVGDLLGPTLENLGNLIKMPGGCGEQNMLGFAPNIYVLQYLEASDHINKVTREKLIRFMKSGYQRELNYKHPNGGYSAFGKSDDSGSTWLTAFVVKSYAQCRPYISVDDEELDISSSWLKSTQNEESGCFTSRGKVLHKAMKGGVTGDKPLLLTAYVMAALLEAGVDSGSPEITKAMTCLRAKDPESTGKDFYEMSLKAYALSLAKSPETPEIIGELLSAATNSTSGTYWDVPDSSGSGYTRSEAKVPPVAVETAGYVVLAMMNTDADRYMSVAHLIIRWISTQRNSQGGFISTQDTVVALQALALYESYQTRTATDLTITATGSDFTKTFSITNTNKLLNQRHDVKTVPSTVQMKMEGSGCALMQGVVRYNVFDARPSEALNVSVSVFRSHTKCKANEIKVCARYLLRDGESNMAVIEVNLVSGFIPDKQSLKRVVGYGTGVIKRYEVDGNSVLFYVDELTPRETCVEFEALQEVEIRNRKEGTVKVYDYYEPKFQVTDKYSMPYLYCRDFIDHGPIFDIGQIITEAPADVNSTTPAETTPSADDDLASLVDALDAIPLP